MKGLKTEPQQGISFPAGFFMFTAQQAKDVKGGTVLVLPCLNVPLVQPLPRKRCEAGLTNSAHTSSNKNLKKQTTSTQESKIPLSLAMERTFSIVISLSSAISAITSALIGSCRRIYLLSVLITVLICPFSIPRLSMPALRLHISATPFSSSGVISTLNCVSSRSIQESRADSRMRGRESGAWVTSFPAQAPVP